MANRPCRWILKHCLGDVCVSSQSGLAQLNEPRADPRLVFGSSFDWIDRVFAWSAGGVVGETEYHQNFVDNSCHVALLE